VPVLQPRLLSLQLFRPETELHTKDGITTQIIDGTYFRSRFNIIR